MTERRDTPRRAAKKLITIRLPKSLLEDLKLLAKLERVPYQRLVNRALEQLLPQLKQEWMDRT